MKNTGLTKVHGPSCASRARAWGAGGWRPSTPLPRETQTLWSRATGYAQGKSECGREGLGGRGPPP